MVRLHGDAALHEEHGCVHVAEGLEQLVRLKKVDEKTRRRVESLPPVPLGLLSSRLTSASALCFSFLASLM